jgi:diguanylate cyclase (GGDEF)-like protein
MLTNKAAQLRLQSEIGKRQQTESDLRKSEAELALARYRDRVRMDELERIVDARTRDLKVAATHDKLTGLPNRAQLHEVISSALSRSRLEAGYRFSLLFLDFDRFKIINDSLGHAAGDMLLTGIAQRLRRALSESQNANDMHTMVARLGGDEFCIVLGGVQDLNDVEAFSAHLLERLCEPHHLSGREVHSSASIGITHSSPEYQQAEEMLRDADTAMYRAKSMGRSRFVVFDQQMHIDAIRRLVLENDLRGAVDRGELKLVYQPVIQLDNNRIVSAEALVRWHHPTRGLIPPIDFITVAEENGLIHAIGLWTIERAAEQAVSWSKRFPHQSITISVNVSRKQLSMDLIDELRGIRARTGVKPEQLILEITETTLTEHPTLAREVLEALQSEGFSIYLDDFGTGYSSLSCLTSFPLDGIKLDRSFISDSTGRRDRVALVHGMVTLAHDLELILVAEGIESIEQAAMLETLQCHRGQGFLFARPTDPFTLERLLEEAEGSVGCLAKAA